ncbi:MAG: type II secretion system F family protein [Dehalococcoidia bacterium]
MIITLIMVTFFCSVMLMTVALAGRNKTSVMESRIQAFRQQTNAMDDFGPNLDVAFTDRVLKPGAESLARLVSRVLPQSMLADVQHQLMVAGHPMRYNTYLSFWGLSTLLLSGMGLLIFASAPTDGMFQKLLAGGIFVLLGWSFPRMWLKGKVKAKQKAVIRSLPDTMDMITTCVEAGLGLDAALSRVAEKGDGPLADEMQKMLLDIGMGKLRREAMTELSERVGVDELTNFFNSIMQAEQLGVGIAQVLRVQSEQMRTQRRQRAERQAHEAPIKMLFPLVLFVFPAFLGVILGPAVIRIAVAF